MRRFIVKADINFIQMCLFIGIAGLAMIIFIFLSRKNQDKIMKLFKLITIVSIYFIAVAIIYSLLLIFVFNQS